MKQKFLLFKTLMLMLFLGVGFSSTALGQATLMHSYTFEEGTYDATTVNDQVGSVNGTLNGVWHQFVPFNRILHLFPVNRK